MQYEYKYMSAFGKSTTSYVNENTKKAKPQGMITHTALDTTRLKDRV